MYKEEKDEEITITGDASIPYASWKAYEDAVASGKEPAPPEIKVKGRPEYSFSVDKALDSIDLTFNGYIPSLDAINFFNVIRLVLGEEPEVENSLMHYFLVDLVFGNIKRENYPYSKEINDKIIIDTERIAIIASRMSAKALTLDSKVYTPSGHTTIRDVAVGDDVLDRDGKRCKVIAKSPLFNKDVYKITLADGRTIKTSGDHDNIVWKKARQLEKGVSRCITDRPSGMQEVVMTTEQMYKEGVTTNRTPLKEDACDNEMKFYIPVAGRLEQEFDYEQTDYGFDAYTTGVILGDGSVEEATGYTRIVAHKDDIETYNRHIPYEFGTMTKKYVDGLETDNYMFGLLQQGARIKKWIGTERSYTKRVPELLMRGSYFQRMEVLKGLMDTDGTAYKNGYCSFTSVSKGLAEDVQELVRSLGGIAFITESDTASPFGKAWSTRIKINKPIFKLKRKLERQHVQARDLRVGIKSIEKIDTEPTQCIAVSSPTKSFLTDGYTVTHNSTVITAYLPIYCAVTGKIPNFGDIMFMVGFGDSQQAGAKVQANTIRDFCSDSVFCKNYFEKMRFTDEECEFIRKGEGPIKKRAFMYKVKGAAGGSVRGIRYRTERPACHAVGTKIMTDHGVMNVEDYPYNYGEFEEYGKVVQVRGLVDKETVSSDHKYWAKKCDRKQVQDPELKTRVLVGNESEPTWTEAQTLTARHWIGEPIDYEVVAVPELMYKETVITERKLDGTVAGVGSKEVMKPHPMMNDPEFWWAYGLWLGDGVCYKKNDHTVVWTVADAQAQYTDRLRVLFAKYDKSVCTVQMKGCHTVIASDAALARWLSGHKEGNSVKNIPGWVVKIDIAYQLEIVKGYIAADGFVDKRGNQIRINSVNLDALQKLQKMANRLGLPTYIRNMKQAGTQLWFNGVTSDHKHQYELRFSIGCAEILGFDEIVDSTKVMFKQVHIKDGWVWRQVKSVEDTEDKVKLVPITCFNAPMDGLPKHTYLTSFGLSKNCFLFDDIIKSEAEANSPVIMKKLHSMIYADAENALGRKGFIIAVNTPFNKKDPVYSALEGGIWTPICLPLCEKISLDLKEEEYISSWPSMHPYAKTMKRYTNAFYGGTLREFNQELMLRISSEEDRMIKDDMIQWFNRKSVVKALDNFTILITTDFTASNVTKNGDNSGIAVWAIGADDDKYLVDLELKNRTIQEQYDALFMMVSKWGKHGRVLEVGIEVDGQQKLNLFALKQMMIEKGIWFRFARQKGSASNSEGILSRAAGGNKHMRFKYMMPSFERHKMHFAEELRNTADMKEMLEELNYVTFESIGSKKDDGLDLISQLGMIEYILPTNGTVLDSDDSLTGADKRIWGDVWGDEDKETRGSEMF